METYSFIAKAIKFDGFKYPDKSLNDNDLDIDDSSTEDNRKRSMQVVEKRLDYEVKELAEKCNRDKKLLGLVVHTIHSLHSKDNKSHIYVDFQKQFNADKNNCIVGPVTLTISDNEVDIPNVFELVHTPDTEGHFGVKLEKEHTDKIKKKLSKSSQKLVTCSIYFKYLLDGKIEDKTIDVGMIRGLNY